MLDVPMVQEKYQPVTLSSLPAPALALPSSVVGPSELLRTAMGIFVFMLININSIYPLSIVYIDNIIQGLISFDEAVKPFRSIKNIFTIIEWFDRQYPGIVRLEEFI